MQNLAAETVAVVAEKAAQRHPQCRVGHAEGGGEFICGLADETPAVQHHRAQGAVEIMRVLALVISLYIHQHAAQHFLRPLALWRVFVGELFFLKALFVPRQLLLGLDAHIQAFLGMIPVPVGEETAHSRWKEAAQPPMLGVGRLQRFISQQLGQEIMQGILCVMMREAAPADETVERIMISCVQFLQRCHRHGLMPTAQS